MDAIYTALDSKTNTNHTLTTTVDTHLTLIITPLIPAITASQTALTPLIVANKTRMDAIYTALDSKIDAN